jgi:hypothetical protein
MKVKATMLQQQVRLTQYLGCKRSQEGMAAIICCHTAKQAGHFAALQDPIAADLEVICGF